MRLRYPKVGARVVLLKEHRLHGARLSEGTVGIVVKPGRMGDEICVDFQMSTETLQTLCDADEIREVPDAVYKTELPDVLPKGWP